MSPGILIADDEESLRWVLERGLRQAGYEVTAVADGEAAIQAFEADPVDLVFLDIRMPRLDGLAVLERLRAIRPDACVVVMTAHGTMDTAITAMQRGAYDYLAKPFDLEEVLLLTERALTASRLSQEVTRLRRGLEEVREFSALIGRHPRMQDVYKIIGRIAGTDVTVLLRGESGTGKELVARAVHSYSRRSGRPFVAVSCAAIPITLLESEMFGHERGAFTDAKERRLGKFELAHGGTLYLDEIGDMPLELQSKLLRALQERTIERLGGHEPIRVDVRVLAATNRDLEAMVKENRFREDLYYRLNVIPIDVPPLRQRRDDIAVLMDYFLHKHSAPGGRQMKISADARKLLMDYAWPGNVRQLESAIERAMLLAESDEITIEDLPVEIRSSVRTEGSGGFKLPPEGISFEELERSLIIQAMEQTGWNITRAAKLLGLSFRTLQYRLDKFGIERPNRKGKGEQEEGEEELS